MATVYKAYDTRLEREEMSLARNSDPNIIVIYDFGEMKVVLG